MLVQVVLGHDVNHTSAPGQEDHVACMHEAGVRLEASSFMLAVGQTTPIPKSLERQPRHMSQ